MTITLPAPVTRIISTLTAAGFEAYAVGGCVRDCLLGREPGDWDIATSALPEEVIACFPGERVLETGVRHGTVTVMLGGAGYEVTTFRVDGGYSDHRRPDSVRFTRSITDDLARRDFTVNAMAYNDTAGLTDPFGGRDDLSRKRIACVGDPSARFREDALRVLRALRFASTLDFTVDPATAAAMRECAPLLAHVSAERVRAELDKALLGPGVARAFIEHSEILAQVIPELKQLSPSIYPGVPRRRRGTPTKLYVFLPPEGGETQVNRDAPLSIVNCQLSIALPDLRVRLALLLGCLGEEGAAAVLARLRYDGDTQRRVEKLVRFRELAVSADERGILGCLHLLGEEDLRLLLAVRRAGNPSAADAAEAALDDVLGRGLCYRLSGLAVTGRDLTALGVREGPDVGRTLAALLDRVITGELPNDREALLRAVADDWRLANKCFT